MQKRVREKREDTHIQKYIFLKNETRKKERKKKDENSRSSRDYPTNGARELANDAPVLPPASAHYPLMTNLSPPSPPGPVSD